MFRRRAVLWLSVAVLATIGLLAACGGPTTQQPTPTVPPQEEKPTKPAVPADGLTVLETRCTACHSLDRVQQAQKTYDEWAQTVDRMIAKGAHLSEEERAVLLKYLVETYGP